MRERQSVAWYEPKASPESIGHETGPQPLVLAVVLMLCDCASGGSGAHGVEDPMADY
ncbi:MAG: hypothetical protein P8008_04405 [Gammaproteobacteria bacterium]